MDIQDIKKMNEQKNLGDSIEEIESEDSLNSLKKYLDEWAQEHQ